MLRIPFVLSFCLAITFRLHAQEYFHADRCVKLSDVIAEYNRNHPDKQMDQAPGKEEREQAVEGEGSDFQFRRAIWYWQQHLDEDGYIVPEGRRWEAWQAYLQKNSHAAKGTSNNANWVFQGPDRTDFTNEGNVGRTNGIGFHPTDSNTFWVACPEGGAWKTTNNGLSWTCMTDNTAIHSVSDVVINQHNPNTIYLATGDKFWSFGSSLGVFKSYDGGTTWNTTGLSWTTTNFTRIYSLVMSKADTSILLAATTSGIYRTTNGGANWTLVDSRKCYSIVCHPQNPNVLFATAFYTYSSTFNSGQILRSSDGGVTWTQVTNFTAAAHIELAVTPASPKVVKAVASTVNGGLQGIYSSSDTGLSFRPTLVSTGNCSQNWLNYYTFYCGGQGDYDLALAISPVDTSRVYLGGNVSCMSTDGGANWNYFNTPALAGPFVIHPDIHAIAFSPTAPGRLYFCSDGGICKTDNVAVNVWSDITTGLGIGEFYKTDVSNIANFTLGGLQDCGGILLRNGGVQTIGGGDVTMAKLDWSDTNRFYTGYQNGIGINRLDRNGSSYTLTDIGYNILGAATSSINWVTPFLVHPLHPDSLIISMNGVYLSGDRGNTWHDISNNIAALKHVSTLAMTPADSNTIYAYDNSGHVIYSTFNLGTSWSQVACPYTGYISDIKLDPRDKMHFWVSFSGYTGTKIAEYKPPTGWTDLSGNLPNVSVNCLLVDTNTLSLYAGTDLTVFLYDTSSSQWNLYNTNLPLVPINELAINYSKNELWAATYGRSLWKSPRQLPAVSNAVSNTTLTSFQLFPNPGRGHYRLANASFSSHSASCVLLDNSGRVVWTRKLTFDHSGYLDIDLSGIPSGQYVLTVNSTNAQSMSSKLIIE